MGRTQQILVWVAVLMFAMLPASGRACDGTSMVPGSIRLSEATEAVLLSQLEVDPALSPDPATVRRLERARRKLKLAQARWDARKRPRAQRPVFACFEAGAGAGGSVQSMICIDEHGEQRRLAFLGVGLLPHVHAGVLLGSGGLPKKGIHFSVSVGAWLGVGGHGLGVVHLIQGEQTELHGVGFGIGADSSVGLMLSY